MKIIGLFLSFFLLNTLTSHGQNIQPSDHFTIEGEIEQPIEKNPKKLSTIYIKCVATDGYTVLFSWNEIFNTETGDHAMMITEKDGTDYTKQEDRIALISPTDRATGRRYVKSLDKIVIQSVK